MQWSPAPPGWRAGRRVVVAGTQESCKNILSSSNCNEPGDGVQLKKCRFFIKKIKNQPFHVGDKGDADEQDWLPGYMRGIQGSSIIYARPHVFHSFLNFQGFYFICRPTGTHSLENSEHTTFMSLFYFLSRPEQGQELCEPSVSPSRNCALQCVESLDYHCNSENGVRLISSLTLPLLFLICYEKNPADRNFISPSTNVVTCVSKQVV